MTGWTSRRGLTTEALRTRFVRRVESTSGTTTLQTATWSPAARATPIGGVSGGRGAVRGSRGRSMRPPAGIRALSCDEPRSHNDVAPARRCRPCRFGRWRTDDDCGRGSAGCVASSRHWRGDFPLQYAHDAPFAATTSVVNLRTAIPVASPGPAGTWWSSISSRRAAKAVSVADKAAEVRAIAGRNRVSIETPNGRLSGISKARLTSTRH